MTSCTLLRISEVRSQCEACGKTFSTSLGGDPTAIKWECPGPNGKGRPSRWVPSDYERPKGIPITTRNLLFHLMPDRGGQWRWHAEMLKKYWHVFNGRKALGLTYGVDLERTDAVLSELPKFDHVYVTENNPKLREGATFTNLLDYAFTLDPTQATFFCHGKAVRYPADHVVWIWTRYMYEQNLDDVDRVNDALSRSPCAGALQYPGVSFDQNRYYPWHYSGSFYWFHNASLFSFPNWEDIEQRWYCVEPYLAQFWSMREAHSWDEPGHTSSYERGTWERILGKRLPTKTQGAAPPMMIDVPESVFAKKT